ncbi:hypothetical protein AB6A40_005294 [Gnathostoma spinigerum]|uniref:Uncharacterized protein n=1 Tax=Gnathostoma spinigerum TaxID=75299 RepID=A0ABD6EQP7_9BILA
MGRDGIRMAQLKLIQYGINGFTIVNTDVRMEYELINENENFYELLRKECRQTRIDGFSGIDTNVRSVIEET